MVSYPATRSFIKHLFYIKMYKHPSITTPIIFSKQDVITSTCTNFLFKVHKGSNFRLLKISRFEIGYKFGEFVLTRKPHSFVQKKKKNPGAPLINWMGLSSLPVLNKITSTGSWLSLWQLNKTSPFLLNTSLAIEIMLKKLTQERFFFSHGPQLTGSEQQYTTQFYTERTPTPVISHTFLGEVWFLHYAQTLIISPMYISTKYVDERRFKIRVQDSLLVTFWLHYHHCF